MKHYVLAVMMLVSVSGAQAQSLKNESFEVGGFTNWFADGPGWKVSNDEHPHSGGRCAVNAVTTNSAEGYEVLHQEVPVMPGHVCSGGVWIRTVNAISSVSYFEIQFLDAEGAILEQFQSDMVGEAQIFGFHGVDRAVAPAGTDRASVRGVIDRKLAPASGSDTHVFDDFKFTARPGGIVPEAGTTNAPARTSTKISQ